MNEIKAVLFIAHTTASSYSYYFTQSFNFMIGCLKNVQINAEFSVCIVESDIFAARSTQEDESDEFCIK